MRALRGIPQSNRIKPIQAKKNEIETETGKRAQDQLSACLLGQLPLAPHASFLRGNLLMGVLVLCALLRFQIIRKLETMHY